MGGHRLVPDDVVLASKKLGRDDAVALAETCDTVIVARGKKVTTFEVSAHPGDEMVLSRAGRAQDFPACGAYGLSGSARTTFTKLSVSGSPTGNVSVTSMPASRASGANRSNASSSSA